MTRTAVSSFPLSLFLSLSIGTALPATALTIHVPGSQPTIQAGIDAALDGDTVLVAPGTYQGPGNVDLDFSGKAIAVASSEGAELTVIRCAGSDLDYHRGVIFHSGEGVDSSLRGFTITGGVSAAAGGGIFCQGASPAIDRCVVEDNIAIYGGGIGGIGCAPRITNTLIRANGAVFDGGGLNFVDSSPWIESCQIHDNTADEFGGGMQTDNAGDAGGPVIRGTSIASNIAGLDGAGFYGYESALTFEHCAIDGNFADDSGAGAFFYNCTGSVSQCIVSDNQASWYGGGLYIDAYWLDRTPLVTNCIVTGNLALWAGGGIYLYEGAPSITNCTLSANQALFYGGAIRAYHSYPEITNSIFWGDTPDEIHLNAGGPTIRYSLVAGGWQGEGNIDADPEFISWAGYDLLLGPGSPCIDAGDPAIQDWLYDWHPRIPDGYVDGVRSDIGAYGGPGNVDWFR